MVSKKQSEPQNTTLEPRIHADEFFFQHPNLSREVKAGFLSYCNNKIWMRKSQWEDSLKKYLNR